MSQSEKFVNRSEDTYILDGVSKTDTLMGPQHSTFSSLVDNWEQKSKITKLNTNTCLLAGIYLINDRLFFYHRIINFIKTKYPLSH